MVKSLFMLIDIGKPDQTNKFFLEYLLIHYGDQYILHCLDTMSPPTSEDEKTNKTSKEQVPQGKRQKTNNGRASLQLATGESQDIFDYHRLELNVAWKLLQEVGCKKIAQSFSHADILDKSFCSRQELREYLVGHGIPNLRTSNLKQGQKKSLKYWVASAYVPTRTILTKKMRENPNKVLPDKEVEELLFARGFGRGMFLGAGIGNDSVWLAPGAGKKKKWSTGRI